MAWEQKIRPNFGRSFAFGTSGLGTGFVFFFIVTSCFDFSRRSGLPLGWLGKGCNTFCFCGRLHLLGSFVRLGGACLGGFVCRLGWFGDKSSVVWFGAPADPQKSI